MAFAEGKVRPTIDVATVPLRPVEGNVVEASILIVLLPFYIIVFGTLIHEIYTGVKLAVSH